MTSLATPPASATSNIVGEPPRRRIARRTILSKLLTVVLCLVVLVVFCVLWHFAYRDKWVNPIFISHPRAVWNALWDGIVHGTMLSALRITLYETIVGFAIATGLGVVVGTALYEMPLLNRVAQPYLTLLNNLPRLALSPLFVLWFGIGHEARIALVVSFVFFIIVLNTYAGFKNSDRDRLLLARALGASRIETFLKFQIPDAIPTIFAGLQLGLTYSFLGAVVGDMMTGGDGIGAMVTVGLTTYRVDQVYAEIIIMAVVATILSGAIRMLEDRLLRWRRHEMRGLVKR